MKRLSKHELTKAVLDENKVWVEFDDNGQPIVYQKYIQTDKTNCEKRWKEKRNYLTATGKHKYGNDLVYPTVPLKLYGVRCIYTLSNIVWIYFNGQIPQGYDIDHIDDNPMNNRLDNLQLLTRKENLNKRGYGYNQFNSNWSKEEIEERVQKNKEKKMISEERKIWKDYKFKNREEYYNVKAERDELLKNIKEEKDCHIRSNMKFEASKLKQRMSTLNSNSKISYDDYQLLKISL